MAGDIDLNALIAGAQKRQGSPKCFAHYLEGQAAEYVQIMRDKTAAEEYVNGAQVTRDLEEHFGVSVDPGAVRRHLASRCKSCQK